MAAHTITVNEGSAALVGIGPCASGIPFVGAGASADPTCSVLGVPGGGIGSASITAHTVVVAEGTSPLVGVGPGTLGLPRVGAGGSADPNFADLTVAGGGTGLTTISAHAVMLGEGASPVSSAAPGTAGFVLTSNGASADPSFAALTVAPAGVTPGSALQLLATNAAGTASVWSTIQGDLSPLSGTPGGFIVSGWEKTPLSFSTLVTNQTVEYNGTDWVNGPLDLASTNAVTNVLGVANGGTGDSTITNHELVLGRGTGTLASLASGTTGQPLLSNGSSVDPSFGTLGVSGGGTGDTTLTSHGVLVGEGTGAVVSVGPATTGLPLLAQGGGTDPAFGSISLSGGAVSGTLPLASVAAPTGTGFSHVTSGAWDSAARAVNLSTADVTGNLPVASIAPSGTNGQYIRTVSGVAAWSALGPALTCESFSSSTTFTAPFTGYYFTQCTGGGGQGAGGFRGYIERCLQYAIMHGVELRRRGRRADSDRGRIRQRRRCTGDHCRLGRHERRGWRYG